MLKEEVKRLKLSINEIESEKSGWDYTNKLKKVKACRSSVNNILRYCPEAEFYDNVDVEDFDSLKEAAIKHLTKFAKNEPQWNKENVERYKKRIEMLNKFIDIQNNESLKVSKSPYSNSFYLHKQGEVIDWCCKPEGSYRLSNHWNFDGHCKSDEIKKDELAIGRYVDGKYIKIC